MKVPPIALLTALVLVLAFLAILAAKLKPRDGLFSKPWPLEAKRRLLTERERALFQRLARTLPNHIVLASPRLRPGCLCRSERHHNPFSASPHVNLHELPPVLTLRVPESA